MSKRSLKDGSDGSPECGIGYLEVLRQVPGKVKHGHDGLDSIVLVKLVPKRRKRKKERKKERNKERKKEREKKRKKERKKQGQHL